eukprot:c5880_g1_i1.p1 GENE.c5880_g1_i1~~c5880_g1_i1.p1  ORF type:complete len:358 (-),score=95.29 c5880_g1_i1:19-1065(-)
MRCVVLLSFCALTLALPHANLATRFPDFSKQFLTTDVNELIEAVRLSGIAQIVELETTENQGADVPMKSGADSPYVPVVQMHGMGDFADNPLGMVPLKKAISKELNGTYVMNAALGPNIPEDMMGSFLEIMDKEVEMFAKSVRADTNLASGFNAIGYSQGALIIRGYIEKYNDPPVQNFISIHGPLVGVAGFPHCNFSSEICKLFDNFLGEAAYNAISQNILAQANYFRDPLRISQYLAHNIWLPLINNENSVNDTRKANFASLKQLVCVKALGDTMVWPNESEWWGFYQDNSTSELWTMKDTPWFQQDTFGLQTLVNSNRYSTYTTPGDHLQFDESFLLGLVDKYFK